VRGGKALRAGSSQPAFRMRFGDAGGRSAGVDLPSGAAQVYAGPGELLAALPGSLLGRPTAS